MGDPRHLHKKYQTPMHPWERTRIDEERELVKQYGFVNKRELWKMRTKLTDFKDQAKKLSANSGKQVEKETKALLEKLRNLNLLKQDQELNDILSIGFTDLLDRRLQSVLYKKSLARSMTQARQMIVHRHIVVNNIKITSPSYLVKSNEEAMISFSPDSPFAQEGHPERVYEQNMPLKPEEKTELSIKRQGDQRRDHTKGRERSTKAHDHNNKGKRSSGRAPMKGKKRPEGKA
jgi:small subunit ribosomal protein S4